LTQYPVILKELKYVSDEKKLNEYISNEL